MSGRMILGLGLAQLLAAYAFALACNSTPTHEHSDRLRDPHDVPRVVQSHDKQ